jgi:hypothetical protein
MGDPGRMNPVDVAWGVDSPGRLSDFLLDLADRARRGESPVENDSSLAMIEAAGSWVESIDAFLANHGKSVAELSPWAAVAMVFAAGLVYE